MLGVGTVNFVENKISALAHYT